MPKSTGLPVPKQIDLTKVSDVRRVDYSRTAESARVYAVEHGLTLAANDSVKIGLLLIDCQLTFCHPDFELYVGGRSGTGALDDTRRLCEFIYRNIDRLTHIHPTLDTHTAMQIFFDTFFVDSQGNHPAPMTMISAMDLKNQTWRLHPTVAAAIGQTQSTLQQHVLYYAEELERLGKYQLTVWPYHAMLGGIGHALVPLLEEAILFHGIARGSHNVPEIKGQNELTENYSALRPEVLTTFDKTAIAWKNTAFIDNLLSYDKLIIGGQAKSHCVAWTVEDLLTEIIDRDPVLAGKVYLLEDCTSAVVVPGIVDFTEQVDAAYARFEAAGMHLVKSTDPIESWPDMQVGFAG